MITRLSDYQLLSLFDKTFRFERCTARGEWVPTDPKLDLARQFRESRASALRPLKAVLTAPSMVPATGRLLVRKGYDEEAQVFLQLPDDHQPIPEAPDLAAVNHALGLLWSPVQLFPYAAHVDQTVMLTALLTAAVRPLLPTAPGFAIDAPVQGAGKTALIKVLAALSGAMPAVSPQPTSANDEEMRKRLFALALAGDGLVVIDNVVGEIDSPSLATFLTGGIYQDRVLGESRTEHVPTSAMVLLSGNNLTLKGDLARRFLVCRIDPKMEHPHQRHFPFDPVEVATTLRQDLVAAALTLLKAFRTLHGQRVGHGRVASFELWDDAVRQTVCWLAHLQATGALPTGAVSPGETYPQLADPMEAINSAVREDPSRIPLEQLLKHWARVIGTHVTKTVREVIDVCGGVMEDFPNRRVNNTADYDFRDVLVEIAGDPVRDSINARRLGKWLAKQVDRVVAGLCLRYGGEYQGVLRWYVEDMTVRQALTSAAAGGAAAVPSASPTTASAVPEGAPTT